MPVNGKISNTRLGQSQLDAVRQRLVNIFTSLPVVSSGQTGPAQQTWSTFHTFPQQSKHNMYTRCTRTLPVPIKVYLRLGRRNTSTLLYSLHSCAIKYVLCMRMPSFSQQRAPYMGSKHTVLYIANGVRYVHRDPLRPTTNRSSDINCMRNWCGKRLDDCLFRRIQITVVINIYRLGYIKLALPHNNHHWNHRHNNNNAARQKEE